MKQFEIYQVDSFFKAGTDRKGISNQNEDNVRTNLKPNSWHDHNFGNLQISTGDSQAPEWGDHFLVTIEKIEIPTQESKFSYREFKEKLIAERANAQTQNPAKNGRKFR